MDKPGLVGVEITGDRKIGNQIKMDLEDPGEYIEVPLYPNEEKKEEKVDPADIIRARMEECWYK